MSNSFFLVSVSIENDEKVEDLVRHLDTPLVRLADRSIACAPRKAYYSKTILACDGDNLVTVSFSLKYTPTPRASPT